MSYTKFILNTVTDVLVEKTDELLTLAETSEEFHLDVLDDNEFKLTFYLPYIYDFNTMYNYLNIESIKDVNIDDYDSIFNIMFNDLEYNIDLESINDKIKNVYIFNRYIYKFSNFTRI